MIKHIISAIKKKSDYQAAFSNSLWLFAEKFARGILGVFVGAWVARYLGPDKYGMLSYVLAVISFFQVIAYLGLDSIVVREITEHEDDEGKIARIIGVTISMRLIAGMICWALSIATIYLLLNGSTEEMLLILLLGSTLLIQSVDTIDLWFQSQSRSKKTVNAKLIGYGVANILKVTLILTGASLIFFGMAMVVEAITVAIALIYAYKKFSCGSPLQFRFEVGEIKILDHAWPIIFSGISVVIYMRLDQIIIGNFLGSEQVGIFTAMASFSSLWNVIPGIVCTSLMPMVAKIKGQSEKKYYEELTHLFRFFILICIIIIVLINIEAKNLISLLYGEQYLVGVNTLRIYIFTIIPVFLGVGQTLWIINEKKTKLLLVQTVIGGIFSIVLNLILIPIYGIEGAAVGAVVSYAISAMIVNMIICKKLFFLQMGINKFGS